MLLVQASCRDCATVSMSALLRHCAAIICLVYVYDLYNVLRVGKRGCGCSVWAWHWCPVLLGCACCLNATACTLAPPSRLAPEAARCMRPAHDATPHTTHSPSHSTLPHNTSPAQHTPSRHIPCTTHTLTQHTPSQHIPCTTHPLTTHLSCTTTPRQIGRASCRERV